MSAANTAAQQSTERTTSPTPETGSKEGVKTSKKQFGIRYEEYADSKSYPKVIKKTSPPSPYENVDVLIDFGMPSTTDLEIGDNLDKYLEAIYDKVKDKDYIESDWFDILAEQIKKYRETLLFILNVKVTVLSNNSEGSLLKEWKPDEKVPPQVTQEVDAIKNLFSKPNPQKTTLEKNIERINAFLYKKTDEREKTIFQEILFNIAMGNLGGLYKEFVRRGEK